MMSHKLPIRHKQDTSWCAISSFETSTNQRATSWLISPHCIVIVDILEFVTSTSGLVRAPTTQNGIKSSTSSKICLFATQKRLKLSVHKITIVW